MKRILLVLLTILLLSIAVSCAAGAHSPPVSSNTSSGDNVIIIPTETTSAAPIEKAPMPMWLLMIRGISIGIGALALLFFLIFVTFLVGLKFATRGRISALFLDHKSLWGVLLKIDGNFVHYGKNADQEDYALVDDKQIWTMYPSAFPRILQYPIRAHLYMRGISEPLDFNQLSELDNETRAAMTAKMVHLMSDEAVLKTIWSDVRNTHGIVVQKGGGLSIIIIILLAIIGLLGGFNVYLTLAVRKVLGG